MENINLNTEKREFKRISPNPAVNKLLQDWYKDNNPSEIQKVTKELVKKVSEERNDLIKKSIDVLPKKYDQIIQGAKVNVFGYEKVPYFGVFHVEIEGKYQGEYLFTTVEWCEITMDNNGCSSTLFLNVIHEPQENIIFEKI